MKLLILIGVAVIAYLAYRIRKRRKAKRLVEEGLKALRIQKAIEKAANRSKD